MRSATLLLCALLALASAPLPTTSPGKRHGSLFGSKSKGKGLGASPEASALGKVRCACAQPPPPRASHLTAHPTAQLAHPRTAHTPLPLRPQLRLDMLKWYCDPSKSNTEARPCVNYAFMNKLKAATSVEERKKLVQDRSSTMPKARRRWGGRRSCCSSSSSSRCCSYSSPSPF